MNFFSKMDLENRQNRIDRIDQRWHQLYELEKDWSEKAVNYLFLTNSGGAIATLSFLGSADSLSSDERLSFKIGLILFAFGVLFVGVTIARAYHFMSSLYEGYIRDASRFYKDSVCWDILEVNDDARVNSFSSQLLFPYIAFFCFITGCFFGGYGFFVHLN